MMYVLDFLNLGFVEFISKTHQHQQTEHSVLKMINNADGISRLRVRNKSINKNIQNPLTSTAVGFDTRRMEDLGSKITAEETPEWAVRSGVDVVLVTGSNLGDGWSRRTVGEESAIEDESIVGDRTVGDEDGRAGADGEGDDGTVFGDEGAEK